MFKQKSCSWSIYMFYLFLCFSICWDLLSSSFFSSKHKLIKLCAAAAKLLQSCLILCDPVDGSPPGSAIPGILQARTLEWVAISFSSAWKWKVKVKSEVSQLCLTLCDPMDCSLPGSSVHGVFQSRVLEWVAIAFSGRLNKGPQICSHSNP